MQRYKAILLFRCTFAAITLQTSLIDHSIDLPPLDDFNLQTSSHEGIRTIPHGNYCPRSTTSSSGLGVKINVTNHLLFELPSTKAAIDPAGVQSQLEPT